MRIQHLSLTNFRNYTRLELDVPPGIVLLHGDNAQGKTNLLEAIYYLSRTRSPRSRADRELLNWLVLEDDLPFARLVIQVQKAEETQQVELSLIQNGTKGLNGEGSSLRKQVRLNGANKRASDVVGLVNAVLFLPEDIDLVTGSPSLRRRYLDDTICQVDPRYSRELEQYENVLTRRNYLLKSCRGQPYDPDEFAFWDQQLVQHGAYLTVRRQQVIQQLNVFVEQCYSSLTGGRDHLRLDYAASVQLGGPLGSAYQIPLIVEPGDSPAEEASIQQVAASFGDQLREARSKELEQGMSIVGPHRDDLRFLIDGVDMGTYGSRGQQRTIALALKLAEVEWLTQEKKDQPILLLDDVMSELDGAHRRHLLDTLDRAQQVLITTTDLGPYHEDFIHTVTLWQVKAGRIETPTRD
jgi:DNA replication and repair protein RecF